MPVLDITLFRSITMFCEIDNIFWNIDHIHTECRNILYNILNPTKPVMDLKNIMDVAFCKFIVLINMHLS